MTAWIELGVFSVLVVAMMVMKHKLKMGYVSLA